MYHVRTDLQVQRPRGFNDLMPTYVAQPSLAALRESAGPRHSVIAMAELSAITLRSCAIGGRPSTDAAPPSPCPGGRVPHRDTGNGGVSQICCLCAGAPLKGSLALFFSRVHRLLATRTNEAGLAPPAALGIHKEVVKPFRHLGAGLSSSVVPGNDSKRLGAETLLRGGKAC